jgi:hypothetical protein
MGRMKELYMQQMQEQCMLYNINQPGRDIVLEPEMLFGVFFTEGRQIMLIAKSIEDLLQKIAHCIEKDVKEIKFDKAIEFPHGNECHANILYEKNDLLPDVDLDLTFSSIYIFKPNSVIY